MHSDLTMWRPRSSNKYLNFMYVISHNNSQSQRCTCITGSHSQVPSHIRKQRIADKRNVYIPVFSSVQVQQFHKVFGTTRRSYNRTSHCHGLKTRTTLFKAGKILWRRQQGSLRSTVAYHSYCLFPPAFANNIKPIVVRMPIANTSSNQNGSKPPRSIQGGWEA